MTWERAPAWVNASVTGSPGGAHVCSRRPNKSREKRDGDMARGAKRKGSFQDDRLVGSLFDDTLAGGGGDDTLVGKRNDDRLVGQAGRDLLKGAAGDDALFGGGGNDRLLGGGGNDMLVGAAGDDLAKGGGGKDTVKGGGGNDRLFGNGGNDRLLGNGGNDDLFGGGGNDKLFGGAGRDDLTGGGGRDDLSGGGGNDKLFGGAGNDKLTGGGGNDRLVGGAGNDRMFGGKGGDTLTGGAGDDVMSGGAGADVFVFNAADGGPSTDTILDFAAGVDRISLAGFNNLDTFDDLTIADTANGAVVSLGGGRQIVLRGVTEGELSGADFGLGPRQVQSGPPVINGGSGDDTLTGTAASELIRGFGGNDVIGTSGGIDTLVGGSGADKFVIRLEGGQIGAGVDIVDDFQYALGDVIGLTEALSGVAYSNISEVVRATPQAGGTMIAVNRGDGFKDALFLKGVAFTTEQLQNYGFSAPALGSAAFVENPYGFTNTSNTTADPVATRDGLYVAYTDKQNLDGLVGDITPFKEDDGGGGIDTNEDQATQDVFVRNLATGSLQRASVGPNGQAMTTDGQPLDPQFGSNAATSQSPAISANGRFVAFATDGRGSAADVNSSGDVYVRDLLTDGDPVLVSALANGSAAGGVPIGGDFSTASVSVLDMSADGRKIVFATTAQISGDDGNATGDIYLRDLDAGTTTLISRTFSNFSGTSGNAGGGVPNPYDFSADYEGELVKISADGRYVFYATGASHVFGNLGGPFQDFDGDVDIYVRDTVLNRTLLVTGVQSTASKSFDVLGFDISDDGSRIAFATEEAIDADDTNGNIDVYVADIDLAAWAASDPTTTQQPDLYTTFRVSEATGRFELAGGDSFAPVLSPDGTRVAFVSNASDIAPVDPSGFSAGRIQLYEVDIATGVVTEAPTRFSIDTSEGGYSSRVAHDLTDDGMVYRKNISSGDTITTGASVASPEVDVPADGSNNVALQVVSGDIVRSSLGAFDVDRYQVFGGSSGFTISAEAAGRGVGTHGDIGVRILQQATQGGPITTLLTDLDSGFGNDAYIKFNGAPAFAYFVEVFSELSFNGSFFNTNSGSYRLRIDYDFPSSGVDTPVQLPLGETDGFTLFGPSSSNWYQYEADAGTRYTVTLDGAGTNQLTTGIIRVRDGQGDLVTQTFAGDDSFSFVAQHDGLGFIEIATSGDTGGYTVSIEEDPFIFIPIPLPPIVIGAAEPEPLVVSQLDEDAAWLL